MRTTSRSSTGASSRTSWIFPHSRAAQRRDRIARDDPFVGSNESRRPDQVHPNPTRQPLPARRTRDRSDGLCPNPGTYLGARFRRIAALCGPQKANVAIQPPMLTAIWHIGHPGALYHDPGADYFTRLHPERAKTRALHQLEAMGYRVTLDRAN